MKRSAKPWSRPLADLIGPAIDPVLARQGFGQSDLVLYWDDIVGERLAQMSQPIKLQWPRRSDPSRPIEPATLVVRVESGFALDFQHCADIVVERVNAHFGWRCVGRVALRQGPLEARRPAREPIGAIEPAVLRRAQESVADIEEPSLRDALARLGARVAAPPRRA